MVSASKRRRIERISGAGKKAIRVRTRGQALVVVGLALTVLMVFIGLGVDVGNMMARRAKLQSAVDSAVLSAAQLLVGNVNTSATTMKANQILEASGIPSNTLNLSRTSVDFPAQAQVHMKVAQRIDTFFMRLIPVWSTVEITAEATADLNSYAEINTKPYGIPGVVNELNLMVWGKDSSRRGGDAYSAEHIGNGDASVNPWHAQLPYGYLYRIDVPPNYPSDHLAVQIFDPDTYNTSTAPPTWPAGVSNPPSGCAASPTPRPTQTPGGPTATRTATPCVPPTLTADMYASCTNPASGTCTSNDARHNTGLKLNAFPISGVPDRPAFWRVDEAREPYTQGISGSYVDSYLTQTQYTLWHFDTHITSAFGDPATLSDQSGGAYLARYTGLTTTGSATDLSWYQPTGFNIQLEDSIGNDMFTRETNGSMYFYLYVQGLAGSSENNFDLRVGPPDLNSAHDCSTAANCNINQQYFTQSTQGMSAWPDWEDGGASILAKRALPLNLDTGPTFSLAFTQISKNAAGQTLGVRHFDQDCGSSGVPPCGTTSSMVYQMQECDHPTNWVDMGVGYTGPNDGWASGTNPDPEPVQIPAEGTDLYNTLFGSDGHCATSWLRLESDPSYSQDTTVWEMPFIRPRLIK